ncbi:MAG TPA: nuclear pore complex subunit [Marinilabiliales bacterium]|nr:nuclear pore complex subunit [Marinilabiliales bacterium]
MEPILIAGTPKTPTVHFDNEKGKIEIKGRSIPENSIEFYKPLVDWLEAYLSKPAQLTEVNIQLEYFNTSSSKCILDVFKKLEAIYKSGNEVVINWHYEEDDEDMLEAGEDYQSIIKIPFKMVEITE